MRSARQAEFEEFVRTRRGTMLRTALVLTGGDAHLAEDLVQTSLVRLFLSWGRARRGSADGYARRILVNCLIDEKRLARVRRELSVSGFAEDPSYDVPDPAALDPELLAALGELPVGMRTAVVLRHVDGLTLDETAAAMSCSTGNVKSQTSRGLERIRELLQQSEGATR